MSIAAAEIVQFSGRGPSFRVIGAERLDHYHRLEPAHIHVLLLREVERGLADVGGASAGCPRSVKGNQKGPG